MPEYHNGEAIITNRIEEEIWYPDYQAVCEVICAGPDPAQMSFYERLPNGKEKALAACKKYFEEFPGPVNQGWKSPNEETLNRWIESCWLSEDQIQKIEAIGP